MKNIIDLYSDGDLRNRLTFHEAVVINLEINGQVVFTKKLRD